MRGAEYRVASVVDIVRDESGEDLASMIDHVTASSFTVPLSTPSGVFPVPGDQWLLRRDLGFWAFDRCLSTPERDARPQTSFREVLATLRARGMVWDSFIDGEHREAPHLAYVGEVRFFPFIPDPYYWVEEGQTLSRAEYPELARVLDPDGTSDTFSVPPVDSPVTVGAYFCAR